MTDAPSKPTAPTAVPVGTQPVAGGSADTEPDGDRTSGDWQDGRLAREWAQGDRLEGLLSLPRRITGDLLTLSERPVGTVVDVGSGPGAFLEALLDQLPGAAGVWTDVSPAMRAIAEERLHRFGNRVAYRSLDAAHLVEAAAPGTVDAVVTSRMSHHLSPAELARFYADADRLLGEWGWIVNLDHVAVPGAWAETLADARRRLVPPNPSPHRHDRPHPTLEDHLDALAGCEGLEVVVAWRAYATVLLVARRSA